MTTALIVLIGYLVLMFLIAWFFSRRESLSAYFLNKKKTSLWLMTFSTVATVIGAGATVAIVSEVYNSGISYGLALPISFLIGMLILGVVAKKIKSIGDEYGAYTIVDFFHKRFDNKNRILTGLLQLFLLIIWIGVQAIAISSLGSVLLGIDFQIALLLTALITILYTAIGGLKIDIITANIAANPTPTSAGGNVFCIRKKTAVSCLIPDKETAATKPINNTSKPSNKVKGIDKKKEFLATPSFFAEKILCQ